MADHEGEPGAISEELCLICATVTIGLEGVCATECEKKLRCSVSQGRGRIYFKIPRKNLMIIKGLRSVENLFVVVAEIKDFDCLFADSVDVTMERFYRLSEEFNWHPALCTWKEYAGYKSSINCAKTSNGNTEVVAGEESQTTCESVTSTAPEVVPRFRVTCTRTHSGTNKKHSFTSMEAAARFGGGINDFFGWAVDLENFDLEVLLNIVDKDVVVGISLTKESLFKRNIVNFGPTTLRSTLAYCLAMAADIKEGKFDTKLHSVRSTCRKKQGWLQELEWVITPGTEGAQKKFCL